MAAPGIELVVDEKISLTPDVVALKLTRADGSPLPEVEAGSHIDIYLPNGLVRQYSLCNRSGTPSKYVIAVKREVISRGGSDAMHQLAFGSKVIAGSPRNNFPISKDARFHLLLAGGIGITPLLSMARQLKHDGVPFRLEYFSRSIELTPFYNEIQSEIHGFVTFHIGLDPAAVEVKLAELLAARADGSHAYICGPAPFINASTRAAAKSWPSDVIHLEHFAPVQRSEDEQNRPFRLTLAESNKHFDVPADKSILDVLRDNHIPCDCSCREGVCGSCMVAVLEGEVDHRDSYLSVAEKQQGEVMMICVSRAKTDQLIIDM